MGITRTLAMEPLLLVAYEPVSLLGVSLQRQIINLLRELNKRLGLTILLISHDLAVVARVCDSIAVIYAGRVVESGPPHEVLTAPGHPYTRALLDATPRGLELRDRKQPCCRSSKGRHKAAAVAAAACAPCQAAEVDPALAVVRPGHNAPCLMVTTASGSVPL